MDFDLFLRLIRNLLAIPTTIIEHGEKDLRNFEANNCFNKALQPMFTTEALTFLLKSCSEGVLYEIIDQLEVCLSFFSFEKKIFFVGPYVKTEYSQQKIESILMENRFSSALAISLKLYYTSLPLVYTNQVQNVINGCILSFSPGSSPLSYRRLSGLIREDTPSQSRISSEAPDYSEIYRRYDAERQFLTTIKNGDVENIQRTYQIMEKNGMQSVLFKKQNSYANPAVSLAIIRALSRKAAEESGLSVITIDEITQHYVQLIDSAQNKEDQFLLAKDMITDLTKAVREYKKTRGAYSQTIQRTIEYIQLHLSEKITLDFLALNANVSTTYLSKLFKKETNLTISDYIAQERCKKAAELLKSTDTSIQEISDYVGYPDNNYFVKVFKKIYGRTPSEYRR